MITFNNEDIQFNLKNKTKLKGWIVKTIEGKKHKAGDISFVFCSDSFLLEMNKAYLNHDTYTDIITFDYSGSDDKPFDSALGDASKGAKTTKTSTTISGDIFISIDRVRENADKFSKTFEDELHRVIIHGVLHLLGYKDKSKVAKEEMTKQEDLCLKALKKA